MQLQKYLAELLGTFALTLAVWLSIGFSMPLSTPLIAAITLGLFVYTVGHVSGAHLNPAITCALISINKIKPQDGALYIVAQFLGAMLAMIVGRMLTGETVQVGASNSLAVGTAEALGALFFAFGVASVAYKKVQMPASGIVVGGSLLLGIYVALSLSNGVLNPAVALGIGSLNPMYILGPVIGAVAGMWAFRFLSDEK
ncbi:aquaporin [Candidatus Peregrinibacteria bacterium]|nr:aquaporin [Candidatus Peregrinibacteria bacterium]